ncbi:branched-chain amino acid transport system permease protein [Hoeflea marina]|uniref:Branched-chain amino acid transport system permease protein n=1 Tax=Hoeflea marina TaxID=274592 RepID=A0A317PL94_9HYPH|nr:branched-chain amino acid ABC transporter permease [Hoeflea marina]PWV98823.1 branched-chain amino acid transport system permease protein [Hoeflea marina]
MLYVQLIADGVVTGCAIGLVAVSFAYFYATTGIFHVAHAGIYTLCGYIAWYLTGLGIPFILALIASILCGALVGMFVQVTLYQTLENKGASPLVKLIASIGVLTTLQNIVAIFFTPNIVQFDLPWRLNSLTIGGVWFSVPQILILLSSVGLFAAVVLFSKYSKLGKRIRAVASNPGLAEITHLNPQRVFVYVIAISSGLVAVPGVLVGVDQALQPYTSLIILLTAVIAMIAGGIGSLGGAFVMSIVLAVIQSLSVAFVSGRWSIAVVFAIFVLFILIRPEGLVRRKFSRAI